MDSLSVHECCVHMIALTGVHECGLVVGGRGLHWWAMMLESLVGA